MNGGEYWIGLFLRFGIPLGLTAGVAWILRNVDEGWRLEASELQPQEDVEMPLAESNECWLIRECPSEQRLSCAACRPTNRTCWQIRQALTGALPDECIECPAFERSLLALAA